METSPDGMAVKRRAQLSVNGDRLPEPSRLQPSLETFPCRSQVSVPMSGTGPPPAVSEGSGDRRVRRSWRRVASGESAIERNGCVPTVGPSLLIEISSVLSPEARAWLCTAAYITSDEMPVVLLLDGVTVNDVYPVLSGPVRSFGCARFGVRFQLLGDRGLAEALAKMAGLVVVVSSEKGARAAEECGGWPVLAADLRAEAARRAASGSTSLLALFDGWRVSA
jgi:hypothetical protein